MALVESRCCFPSDSSPIASDTQILADRHIMCYSNCVPPQNPRSSKDMSTRGREIVRGRLLMRKGQSSKVCGYSTRIAE